MHITHIHENETKKYISFFLLSFFLYFVCVSSFMKRDSYSWELELQVFVACTASYLGAEI